MMSREENAMESSSDHESGAVNWPKNCLVNKLRTFLSQNGLNVHLPLRLKSYFHYIGNGDLSVRATSLETSDVVMTAVDRRRCNIIMSSIA